MLIVWPYDIPPYADRAPATASQTATAIFCTGTKKYEMSEAMKRGKYTLEFKEESIRQGCRSVGADTHPRY